MLVASAPPPADSQTHLNRLVALRMLRTSGDEEYAFRHALLHQAVYATLLRRERRALHRAVAETLVGLYGGSGQFTRYLGDLAYHYAQAEAWAEALHYAQAAGDEALARHAPHEALEHFTRALEAARALGQASPARLYRQRGRAHETLGDFAGAQADYSAALAAAQAARQPQAEWQALLDLGQLWTGRDYDRAGEYFERALALARRFGEGPLLAHSLNRMGNWHLNQGAAPAALERHREALRIFQDLADDAGQAETYDLLGMTSYLDGHLRHGTTYYEEAVALFRALDDRTALASSLTGLMMRGLNPLTETLRPQAPQAVILRAGDEALAVARGNHNRPGEAFVLAMLSLCLAPMGDYARALAVGREALALAEAIGHRQWQTCALCSLGAAYNALGHHAAAAEHLRRALVLAEAIASTYWQEVSRGWLALACVGGGLRAEARALLMPVFDPARPPRGISQRVVWTAQLELALAEGEPAAVLAGLDQMRAAGPDTPPPFGALPRLAGLRADALAALGRSGEALALVEAAVVTAQAVGWPIVEARLRARQSRLYALHGRPAEAEAARAAAAATLAALTAGLDDPELCANFERAAAGWFTPA